MHFCRLVAEYGASDHKRNKDIREYLGITNIDNLIIKSTVSKEMARISEKCT
jgi:hypothetical protein